MSTTKEYERIKMAELLAGKQIIVFLHTHRL